MSERTALFVQGGVVTASLSIAPNFAFPGKKLLWGNCAGVVEGYSWRPGTPLPPKNQIHITSILSMTRMTSINLQWVEGFILVIQMHSADQAGASGVSVDAFGK